MRSYPYVLCQINFSSKTAAQVVCQSRRYHRVQALTAKTDMPFRTEEYFRLRLPNLAGSLGQKENRKQNEKLNFSKNEFLLN